MPKRLAKLGIVSLTAIRIHPKLRRPSIEVNRDSLARCSNRQVDAVEIAIQLRFQRNLLLSLRDAFDDGSTAGHAQGKSEEPVSLRWDVLSLRRSDQGSKKSEKHGENEQRSGWRKMSQKSNEWQMVKTHLGGLETPGTRAEK